MWQKVWFAVLEIALFTAVCFATHDSKVFFERFSDNLIFHFLLKDDENFMSDMYLTNEQTEALFSNESLRRVGYTDAIQQWPSGRVPYEIDPGFSTVLLLFQLVL